MDLGKLSELSQRRVCGECGAEFETNSELSAMQQFADHVAVHNPSPAQWAEAHKRIQAAKAKKGSTEGQSIG